MERPELIIKRAANLLAIQLSAWWLLLALSGATWWDDWVMKSLSSSELQTYFTQTGRPFFYPIHQVLLQSPSWCYPALILLSSFAISWLFYLVVKVQLPERFAFLAAAILAVLPMVTSRVLSIFLPFLFGLIAFFAAWYLLVRTRDKLRIWVQLVIVVLLFWAFTVSSLLVWVLLPLANRYFLVNSKITIREIWNFITRHWPIVVSPIVFWIVNRIFFTPFGPYLGYNNPTKFLHSTKTLLELAAVVIFIVVATWLLVRRFNRQVSGKLDLAVLALLSILLGAVPYLVIGRKPWQLFGFSDRFTLLYPYGIAILIALLLNWIAAKRRILGILVTALVFALGIARTNFALSSYWEDNKTQTEIIAQLKQLPKGTLASTVIFDLRNRNKFAFRRLTPYYEETGWLEVATGDRTHLAINRSDLRTFLRFDHFGHIPRYGAKDYVPGDVGTLVTVGKDSKITITQIPSLIAYEKGGK